MSVGERENMTLLLTYWHHPEHTVCAAKLSYQDVGVCHVSAYNPTIETHKTERKQVFEIKTRELTSEPSDEREQKLGSSERISYMSLHIVYDTGMHDYYVSPSREKETVRTFTRGRFGEQLP